MRSFTALTVFMLVVFVITGSIVLDLLVVRPAHSQPVIRTIQSTDQECPNSNPINLTTTGLTRIVIGAASQRIRICSISFSTTAPEDITFVSGNLVTTACDTSATNITGAYKSVQSMALDFSPFASLKSVTGQDICINQSAAQILGGVVQYALY
jgi:hypothetical protein